MTTPHKQAWQATFVYKNRYNQFEGLSMAFWRSLGDDEKELVRISLKDIDNLPDESELKRSNSLDNKNNDYRITSLYLNTENDPPYDKLQRETLSGNFFTWALRRVDEFYASLKGKDKDKILKE